MVEGVEINAGNVGAAPNGDFTVSVLSNYKRMNVAEIQLEILAERKFKPGLCREPFPSL